MSGKPGSAPAAPKPTAAKPKPKSDPSASKPPVRTASAKPATAESEDEPIAADRESRAKAIPVRRKRVKGLVLRVKCPMCETEGWVPAKAAGRDVRCANKECLVPLFTAPELPKKEEVVEAPKSNISWPIVITAVVGALGAGWAWWHFGTQTSPEEIAGGINPSTLGKKDDGDSPDDPGPKPVDPGLDVGPKGMSLAEIRAKALDRMITESQGAASSSKPIARQRTAAVHARLDDIAEAEVQIQKLRELRIFEPYYEVDAQCELAWAHLRAGRTDEAKAAADKAFQARETRWTGRSVALSSSNLAAVLFAVGRAGDANSVTIRNEFGALAQRLAEASRSFDVDFEMDHSPFLSPVSQASQLVTVQLAARDRWDDATRFAGSRSNEGDRAECLIRVAEMLAARHPDDAAARIDEVVGLLGNSPAAGVALARVAMRHLVNSRPDEGRAALERAVAMLPQSAPAAATLPDAKAVYDKTFTYARPFGTLAAAEVARDRAIEASLTGGNRDNAWDTYQLSLAVASNEAPAVEITSTRVAAAERGAGDVIADLKAGLGLATDGDARTLMTDYTTNLRDVDAAARLVFEAREAILADAARRGLATEVWDLVSSDAAGEPAARLTNTPLVHVLAQQVKGDAATAVQAAVPKQPEAIAVGLVSPETLLANQEDLRKLGEQIGGISGDEADVVFLRIASLIDRERGRERALEFLFGNQRDTVVRAEAARIIEARDARETKPELAWKRLLATNALSGLDMVTAIEGLMLSLDGATDPAKSNDQPVAASADGK